MIKRTITILTCAALALTLAAVSGCNKKVIKAAPAPAPAAAPAAQQPQQPPERESFETVEPDTAAKAVLQTVYFDFDKSDLRPETVERLQLIGKFLSDHAAVSVLAEGHADERGTNEYNIALGEHRAHAIKDWLVNYGVADRRLEITSFGRERPAFPNCGEDENCHSKNRRVEFKVLAK